jgi:hypothetical protein
MLEDRRLRTAIVAGGPPRRGRVDVRADLEALRPALDAV